MVTNNIKMRTAHLKYAREQILYIFSLMQYSAKQGVVNPSGSGGLLVVIAMTVFGLKVQMKKLAQGNHGRFKLDPWILYYKSWYQAVKVQD